MIIEMYKVFRLGVYQRTKKDNALNLDDPYEVRKWAKFFGVTPKVLIFSYSMYILQVLKLRVQESVKKQKVGRRSMKSLYKPLSKNYKKKNKESEGKFWVDTGTLINSMRVWATSENNVKLGIPLNEKLPKSNTPVHMLYCYLEFGTDRIPARPLIHPNLKFLLKNTRVYFEYFLDLVIKGKWNLMRGV